jgi:hypothetical protein
MPASRQRQPRPSFADETRRDDETTPPTSTSTTPPPAMADQPEDHFEPRDTLANTANTALKLTVVGVIFAGVQNTLRKQNVGAMGILTKSGGIIALYGASASNMVAAQS